MELSKIKKVLVFSITGFNKKLDGETLLCQEILNDYMQQMKRFIHFLKNIMCMLQCAKKNE